MAVVTGKLQPASDRTCHGFVDIVSSELDVQGHRPQFLAAYFSESSLWLQVDAQRWDLEYLDIKNTDTDDGWRRFDVSIGYDVVFSLSYRHRAAAQMRLDDPTFDELDEELWDFAIFIARNSNSASWRSSGLVEWRKGFG